MKPMGTLAILIATFVCMWSKQAVQLTGGSGKVNTRSYPADIQAERVAKLHKGMSLDEISDVMDNEPCDLNFYRGQVKTDNTSTVVHFEGRNGDFALLRLVDDRLEFIVARVGERRWG